MIPVYMRMPAALALLAAPAAGPAAPPPMAPHAPLAADPAPPHDPPDVRRSFVAADGQTVRIVIHTAPGTGSYARPRRPNESPDAYFPAVIQEAEAAGAHEVLIPPGTYAFDRPGQAAPAGARSILDVDFQGSVLRFKAPSNSVAILESRHLRLRNFTLDCPPCAPVRTAAARTAR